MKLLLLNGPNLNLTGMRQPDIYGYKTLPEVVSELREFCDAYGCELIDIQSNHEGVLIDAIQDAMGKFDGIILNAGALAHYSYALRDAVACCGIPVVSVHISDVYSRESFRAVDVLADVCISSVVGQGTDGYRIAAERLIGS